MDTVRQTAGVISEQITCTTNTQEMCLLLAKMLVGQLLKLPKLSYKAILMGCVWVSEKVKNTRYKQVLNSENWTIVQCTKMEKCYMPNLLYAHSAKY